MTTHNGQNERIKRQYFSYLKHAKRRSEPTVDGAADAIARFEEYTRWRDFKAFHIEQAVAFMALIRFGGHLPKGEYDVDHVGQAAEAVSAKLHGRLQSGGGSAGARRGQDRGGCRSRSGADRVVV